jgi:hypothetical protein
MSHHPGETAASVRDALSRWWATDGEATVEGFQAVGLTVTETLADDNDERTGE